MNKIFFPEIRSEGEWKVITSKCFCKFQQIISAILILVTQTYAYTYTYTYKYKYIKNKHYVYILKYLTDT